MTHATFLRRSLLVFCLVATGAFLTVFFLHDWFHGSFLARFDMAQPFGDSIGTVIAITIAYLSQRAVSLAFYRDQALGMSKVSAADSDKLTNFQRVADEVSGELKQIEAFNDVVRGQLNGVISETEKAAFSIVERLQTIDGVVTHLDDFVAGTSTESAKMVVESERRIAENQQIVQQMEGYVRQRLQEAEADQLRVSQVAQEARTLESLVQLIKHVAGQTNLLALNAAIEAARAGEAGRGFAVVADEVRKLSTETENAVIKISEGIKSVADSIETQFQDKLSQTNLEKEKTLLGAFSTQLNHLGKSYEDLIRHEALVLDEVLKSSSQLTDMFLEAQASVQFQDVTRQQIEHVIEALDKLNDHSRLLADRLHAYEQDGFSYTPMAQHLEALYSRYVMDGQRNAHDQSLNRQGNSTAAPSQKIELF